jgi:hypothetical protein
MELGDRSSEAVVFLVDPRATGVGCGRGPGPLDADALARSLQADPDLEVTAPLAVTIGGADGFQMDVTPASEASSCDGGWPVLTPFDGSSRGSIRLERGGRLRLYLVDRPEGSGARHVAIAVVAPSSRFDSVLEAATPIIHSIEFER